MHTIRLRGPWQIEPVALFPSDAGNLPAAGEIEIPGDWAAALGSAFRGQARFVRRFGLPTNLDPRERVFLVVGAIVENGTIELNGTALGRQTFQAGTQRYEVTPLLKLRNELIILIESQETVGGILGEVKLEIE